MNKNQAENAVLLSISNWQKACEKEGEFPVVVGILSSFTQKMEPLRKEANNAIFAIQGNRKLVPLMLENLNQMVEKMENEANRQLMLTEDEARERVIKRILKDSNVKSGTVHYFKQGSKRKGIEDTLEIIDLP